MTTAPFPPATPLIQLWQWFCRLDKIKLAGKAAEWLAIAAGSVVYALIVLGIATHALIKASVIGLRILADLLDQLDQQLQTLRQENRAFLDPPTEAPTAPQGHPLADIAEQLMSLPAKDLKTLTRTKRATKAAMVNAYLAMPV